MPILINTVQRWINNTKLIQKRKWYTSKDLFDIFISETEEPESIHPDGNISFKGFVRCINKIPQLDKVKTKQRNYKYIILCKNDCINRLSHSRVSS